MFTYRYIDVCIMGTSSNWAYIQIPKVTFQEMENILEDPEFARFGFFKPKDVTLVLARQFLKNPKAILDLPISNVIEDIVFVDIVGDKIVLKDSAGTQIIEINKDKKLMCYQCDENPHDNKYIDFVSENEKLWPFLKKHEVKYVKPRNKNDKKKIKELT